MLHLKTFLNPFEKGPNPRQSSILVPQAAVYGHEPVLQVPNLLVGVSHTLAQGKPYARQIHPCFIPGPSPLKHPSALAFVAQLLVGVENTRVAGRARWYTKYYRSAHFAALRGMGCSGDSDAEIKSRWGSP